MGKQINGTNAYKYDTLTDTYTQLANIPYQFYTSGLAVNNNDIYLFGSESGAYTTAYKYDTLTNTYTQLANIPYQFYSGAVVMVNHEIYLFGGRNYPTKVQVFTFPTKNYTNKSIVIENGNAYSTELVNTNITNGLPYKFNDFWYAETENNETTFDIISPTYYGNGTEWLGIRNPDVLSVQLNKSSTSIVIGETETLTAIIKPINATVQTVTWSSDDDTVATVIDGVVTAVSTGTCTITVTTTNGGFTDTCEVTVTAAE